MPTTVLQACLNGGRTRAEAPGVPITPDELADEARTARRAGAGELHLHPRSPSGEESLAPDDVAACLTAVRAAVPGMPVSVGTGAWIAPGGRARLDLIRAWEVRPDHASVNLSEEDAPEAMELLLSMGVGIEAGVWSARDAERLVGLPHAGRCLRVLIEMITDDAREAKATYRKAHAVLSDAGLGLPILLHGQDGSLWPMVRLAVERGHDVRVGLEDGLTLPDGRAATSNVAMVRAAARMMGRPDRTPDAPQP